jgi:putative endonuclease
MTVYILKCADGSYYTGVTNNIERRIAEHNIGIDNTCYTFSRRPLELVYHETFQTPSDAIFWEKRIKKWTRRKKEALINSDWEKLHEFAKCNNATSHEKWGKE